MYDNKGNRKQKQLKSAMNEYDRGKHQKGGLLMCHKQQSNESQYIH
jgi:uncharacterized protein HemY